LGGREKVIMEDGKKGESQRGCPFKAIMRE